METCKIQSISITDNFFKDFAGILKRDLAIKTEKANVLLD